MEWTAEARESEKTCQGHVVEVETEADVWKEGEHRVGYVCPLQSRRTVSGLSLVPGEGLGLLWGSPLATNSEL